MASSSLSNELPLEVLLLIIRQCPLYQLKVLRLVSKTFAHLVDPILWQEVILVPHRLCVAGFASLFATSDTTRHITKLTYDARFGRFFPHADDLATVDTSQASIFTSSERRCRAECIQLALLGCFDPNSDMTMEVAMLTKVLCILPFLRKICVREVTGNGDDLITNVPQFYHRMCKKLYLRPEVFNYRKTRAAKGRCYAKGLLTAAFSADLTLCAFKSENLDANLFFGEYPSRQPTTVQQFDILKRLMTSMDKVNITFKAESLSYPPNHLQALQALLKPANKLKTLKLKLTDYSTTLWTYGDEELLSDISPLLETTTGTRLQEPLLPCLESLTIRACVCHEEDLVYFLRLHSRTLRRLELSNITLLGSPERRECCVTLIKQLRAFLKLQSISFNGWFSNGGRQQWFVSKDNAGKERLKARVERYVVDKRIRQCPLEILAIKPSESDVEKPSDGKEYEGDVSWAMIYSRRTDRTLAPPTFGMTSIPAPLASGLPSSSTTTLPAVPFLTTSAPRAPSAYVLSSPAHVQSWLMEGSNQWATLKQELSKDTGPLELPDTPGVQTPATQQNDDWHLSDLSQVQIDWEMPPLQPHPFF